MEGVELNNGILKNLQVCKIDLTSKISPTFLPNLYVFENPISERR